MSGTRAGSPATTVFITGTDTDVGKTFVATALLRSVAAGGLRVVGMKPVATGSPSGAAPAGDAALLLAAGNVAADLAHVAPFSYAPPIAPHVAAEHAGRPISLDAIAAAHAALAAEADLVVVEGAGGAFVPLGPRMDMLDIAVRLRAPVLLVVGVRLGCINHALLSALAVRARGLELIGWVANRIDPDMREADASIAAIAARIAAPLLVTLSWSEETPFFPQEALRALHVAN